VFVVADTSARWLGSHRWRTQVPPPGVTVHVSGGLGGLPRAVVAADPGFLMLLVCVHVVAVTGESGLIRLNAPGRWEDGRSEYRDDGDPREQPEPGRPGAPRHRSVRGVFQPTPNRTIMFRRKSAESTVAIESKWPFWWGNINCRVSSAGMSWQSASPVASRATRYIRSSGKGFLAASSDRGGDNPDDDADER